MKKTLAVLTAIILTTVPVAAGTASAALIRTYAVTITNLTKSQVITPPIVISHNNSFDLFTPGQAAGPELTELAEDGATASLETLLGTLPSVREHVVAPGPVMPGQSVTVEITTRGKKNRLSAAGMLATSNDAFTAFRDFRPASPGSRVFTTPAYDAGSETNSESCVSIPGPPCGNAMVRDTAGAEGFVHIHPGIHGIADLVPATHDWRNPVAAVAVHRVK